MGIIPHASVPCLAVRSKNSTAMVCVGVSDSIMCCLHIQHCRSSLWTGGWIGYTYQCLYRKAQGKLCMLPKRERKKHQLPNPNAGLVIGNYIHKF